MNIVDGEPDAWANSIASSFVAFAVVMPLMEAVITLACHREEFDSALNIKE